MNNKSIYFIYDATNCTPNGDPDGEGQRYDSSTKKAIVSDLRIKRFGRDELDILGADVFYTWKPDSIDTSQKKSGAAARLEAFNKEHGIAIKQKIKAKKGEVSEVEEETGEDDNAVDVSKILTDSFSDIRIYGGVLTSKENKAHITGSLQYNAENSSLNEVIPGKNLMDRGITTLFPSNVSKNEQGSMGRDNYLKYGLFCINGRLDATTAKINGASEADLNLMLMSTWMRVKSINTRSKFGHSPIAIIVVDHPTLELANGNFLGNHFDFNQKIVDIVPNKPSVDIRNRDDYKFDFTPLLSAIDEDTVDALTIYTEDTKFVENNNFNVSVKMSVINPVKELIRVVTEMKLLK